VIKSTFLSDLQTRIQAAERIIADQNENLAALRHLLHKETAEPTPNGSTPVTVTPASAAPATVQESRTHPGVDFKGKTSDIILALVQRSGEEGTRPRDIAEILVEHKLMTKGSNTIYSYLSEFKKKGLVKLKAEGLYVAAKVVAAKPVAVASLAAKPLAVTATPAKQGQKRRKMSAAGREAIRKAQKLRWAAVKRAKG
jgi:hypothetical protein